MAKSTDLRNTQAWLESYTSKCAQILGRSASSSNPHSRRLSTASTVENQILTNWDFYGSSYPHTAQPSPRNHSGIKRTYVSSLHSRCEASLDLIEQNEPEIYGCQSEISRLKKKKKVLKQKFLQECGVLTLENSKIEEKFQSILEKYQLKQFVPIFEDEIQSLKAEIQRISQENINIINTTENIDSKKSRNKLKSVVFALNHEIEESKEIIKHMKSMERKSDMSVRCLSTLSYKSSEFESEIESSENKVKQYQRKITDLNTKMVEIEDINKELCEKLRISNIKREKLKSKVWILREKELKVHETPKKSTQHSGRPNKRGLKMLKAIQIELQSQKDYKSLELTNSLLPELVKLYSMLNKESEKHSKLEASASKIKGSISCPDSPIEAPLKRYTIFSFCK